MDRFTIRQTSAQLPVFDAETDLEPLSRLGGESGFVSDFQFGDATVPALDATWPVRCSTTATCGGPPSARATTVAATCAAMTCRR